MKLHKYNFQTRSFAEDIAGLEKILANLLKDPKRNARRIKLIKERLEYERGALGKTALTKVPKSTPTPTPTPTRTRGGGNGGSHNSNSNKNSSTLRIEDKTLKRLGHSNSSTDRSNTMIKINTKSSYVPPSPTKSRFTRNQKIAAGIAGAALLGGAAYAGYRAYKKRKKRKAEREV